MIIDVVRAIKSLTPNVCFTFDNNGIEKWDLEHKGVTQPTTAEIDSEIIKLKAEYDSLAYSRSRAVAYPSLADQADMQYHDSLNSTTTWKDAIAKVKSDNPKPS